MSFYPNADCPRSIGDFPMRLTSAFPFLNVHSSRRNPTCRNPVPPRRSFVPRLELLESRNLLSTMTVLNNFDAGAGSLRDALKHAHDGDTIVFDESLAGQTITLTSGDLDIKKSLDIQGP